MLYKAASERAKKIGRPLASDTSLEPFVEKGWQNRVARGEAEKITVVQGQHARYKPGRAYVEV